MQLTEQHAPVVEEVSGVDAAVQVADGGLQPGVQLRVDVKLPGIGRLLDLQRQTGQTSSDSRKQFRYISCQLTGGRSTLTHL